LKQKVLLVVEEKNLSHSVKWTTCISFGLSLTVENIETQTRIASQDQNYMKEILLATCEHDSEDSRHGQWGKTSAKNSIGGYSQTFIVPKLQIMLCTWWVWAVLGTIQITIVQLNQMLGASCGFFICSTNLLKTL